MKKSLLVAAAIAVFAGGCFVITPDGEIIGVVLPTVTPRYVAGTTVQVVAGHPGNVFRHNNVYWRYQSGRWWRSSISTGLWRVSATVPRALLSIPSTHPSYRFIKQHPNYRAGVKRPAVKVPAVKRPAVKRPAVKRPAVKRPAVKRPAVKRPAVKRPGGKKPAVKKPAGKKPAGKKPAGKTSKEKKEKTRK